jgi:hypothetical protein
LRDNKKEKKLLEMYSQRKIKYVKKPLGTLLIKGHKAKGTPLEIASLDRYKVTTLNISPQEQSVFMGLYNKGLISGDRLGKGKITEKGKEVLKK